MENELQELKTRLEDKIKIIDERIKRREGPCYFDESKKIEKLHSEAFHYERVIEMINEISTK